MRVYRLEGPTCQRPIIQFESRLTDIETPKIRETNTSGYQDFTRFIVLGYCPTAASTKWNRVLDIQTSHRQDESWEESETQTITFHTNTIQNKQAA